VFCGLNSCQLATRLSLSGAGKLAHLLVMLYLYVQDVRPDVGRSPFRGAQRHRHEVPRQGCQSQGSRLVPYV
jgi:hypothetical protein